MSEKKAFEVVLDSRHEPYEAYQLLVARINTLLRTGQGYHEVKLTKWQLYDNGLLIKGDDDVHISLLRHFYYDKQRNTFGGGFMAFEILEDLGRYYKVPDITEGMGENVGLVFTITVTTP